MFAPLWCGWPLTAEYRGQRRMHSYRRLACMHATSGGYWTYVAMSPCGRFAKIGRSWNPISRLAAGGGIREVERKLGIGRVYLARAYYGGKDMERKCHDFLAPDQVHREWFRVGPRFRILVARLDRKLRREKQRRRARRLRKASAPDLQQRAA